MRPPAQHVAASPATTTKTIVVGFAFLRGEEGPSNGADIFGGVKDISALVAQARFDCLHGGFRSAVHLKGLQDVANVVLDRLLRDA